MRWLNSLRRFRRRSASTQRRTPFRVLRPRLREESPVRGVPPSVQVGDDLVGFLAHELEVDHDSPSSSLAKVFTPASAAGRSPSDAVGSANPYLLLRSIRLGPVPMASKVEQFGLFIDWKVGVAAEREAVRDRQPRDPRADRLVRFRNPDGRRPSGRRCGEGVSRMERDPRAEAGRPSPCRRAAPQANASPRSGRSSRGRWARSSPRGSATSRSRSTSSSTWRAKGAGCSERRYPRSSVRSSASRSDSRRGSSRASPPGTSRRRSRTGRSRRP